MAEAPLYQRDPKAWEAYLAEGNARQARKRVSADALIRDEHGRIMLVDPGYKPGWDMPGGMAEANEPPAECVRRELREELGLDVTLAGLLVVDWVSPHGPWDDLLAFVFSAGTLTQRQAGRIRLGDGELEGYEFCDVAQASDRLNERAWRRLQAALRAEGEGTALYLHDGEAFP